MNTHKDILDNLKTVCQCKGIKKGAFKKLIDEGKTTPGELNKASGAGSGDCQGRRCGPRIDDLLKSHPRE